MINLEPQESTYTFPSNLLLVPRVGRLKCAKLSLRYPTPLSRITKSESVAQIADAG